MSFLPLKSQAALHNLENIVNEKMSLVKQGSGDETTRFRQAVYIDWTKRTLIPDSCGNQPGYSCIISCFVENLMLDNNSHFKTVKGYIESMNTLFKLRGFAIPIDLSDKQNMCTRLIDDIEQEETIAKQQSLLTKEMFVNMGKLAAISPKNSANSVLHDWFCLIRICGFRVTEYAQTTQTKIDVHQYSSGVRKSSKHSSQEIGSLRMTKGQ
jgi:hypothetical protein